MSQFYDTKELKSEERDVYEFAHKFLAIDPVKGLIADHEGVIEGKSMALTQRTVGYLKMFINDWLRENSTKESLAIALRALQKYQFISHDTNNVSQFSAAAEAMAQVKARGDWISGE
jgi:hypothetical protein